MKLKSSNIKNIIQWILAFALAFGLANLLILPYWYAPGWVLRDFGSTPAIYHAGKTVLNGYEGYGFATVDERGYLNEDKPLADEVVLVLGCSHTKGIEVPMDKRYTSLLNDMVSGGDDSKLYVYNMAIDGFYFPQIAAGFGAALQELPSVSSIIIEIPTTEYAPTDFVGYSSRQYSADFTGTTAFENQGLSSKLQTAIKETFPLASLYLSKQFVFEESNKTPFLYNVTTTKENPFPPNIQGDYQLAIQNSFEAMRSLWDGEIIVIYHPKIELQSDGSMKMLDSISVPWFAEVCSQYNIKLIGSGGVWLDAYQKDYTVPYGFSNTAPGQGHLNEDGHKLLADLIYEFMEGVQKQ